MLFIVLEHILIMGTSFFEAPVGMQSQVANFIIGFTYVGVNCFILISGWYGVEFSWKKLLNLYFICAFYELIGFMVHCIFGTGGFDRTQIANIIFPLSHSNIWFIRCYVVLLFITPLLKIGLCSLDKKQLLRVVLLLTIINVYFGWFWKGENYNSTGYTVSQMVYLYVIGWYLGCYFDLTVLRTKKIYLLASYFILAIAWGVCANSHWVIPHWNGWAYNNPGVLMASICLFLFFSCIELRSKTINWFAKGALSVLLVHMNRYIGEYIYDIVRSSVYCDVVIHSLILQVVVLMALALLIFLCLSAFDSFRRFLNNCIVSIYGMLGAQNNSSCHSSKAS